MKHVGIADCDARFLRSMGKFEHGKRCLLEQVVAVDTWIALVSGGFDLVGVPHSERYCGSKVENSASAQLGFALKHVRIADSDSDASGWE